MKYGEQTQGINLSWASINIIQTQIPYEFSFYDITGVKGTEVTTNMTLGLCHKENDFIIY